MKTARVVALLATLLIASAVSAAPATTTIVLDLDIRVETLSRFFRSSRSPLAPLAADFVKAADQNGLDWRLLPSIAMVESSGGIHYKNRNVFGWGNGHIRFHSVRSSIHYIASRLSRSHLYAGKDIGAILRTYNRVRPEYPERVMGFMRRLPADDLRLAELPVPAPQGAHATILEVGYHRAIWNSGTAAVPSRRSMPVETPARVS